MAVQKRAHRVRKAKNPTRRKSATTRRSRNSRSLRRATRYRRTLPSINDLNRAIQILEGHIEQLTSSEGIRSTLGGATKGMSKAVTRTSGRAGEVVADRLSEVANRLRGSATAVTDAARTGVGAMQQVGAQLERRPFMTVAIALGVGFLAGMTSSRTDLAD
jgi:hypothetical protein